MKQLIFIIILNTLAGYAVYAQSQAVTKIVLPAKAGIRLQNTTTTTRGKNLPKGFYAEAPVITSLLHFNNQPVLKLSKTTRKPILVFTELSFGDVLQNSMNGLKPNLVNTYDNHILELFNDAPSLFKIKFIISL